MKLFFEDNIYYDKNYSLLIYNPKTREWEKVFTVHANSLSGAFNEFSGWMSKYGTDNQKQLLLHCEDFGEYLEKDTWCGWQFEN